MAINLQQFLAKQLSDGAIDQQLCDLLNAVADLSKEINDKVTHGAIAGVLGFAGTDNVQGEHQKNLTSSPMRFLWKASNGPVP